MTLQPSSTSLIHFKLLSFDIYGTLIDWESGIFSNLVSSTSFQSLASNHPLRDRTRLIKAYEKLEREIQTSNPAMEYADVLATVYRRLVEDHKSDFTATDAEIDKAARDFGNSVGTWPLFPDTLDALKTLKKHYKLVPLTNSSPTTFGASLAGPFQNFPFDAVYTAADIGSYKPDLRNFEYLISHVEDEFGIGKGEILHVAQSLHHDHVPATKMGLERCWVDREGLMGTPSEEEKGGVTVGWVVKSLGELADLAEKAFEGQKQ